MSEIFNDGPVAFLETSSTAVFFSKGSASAGTFPVTPEGTEIPLKNLLNILNVAYWGEDNRFPQNIVTQMDYCGVGKNELDKKMKRLWGNGIIPGRITGIKDDGSDIFTPLDRTKEKAIYNFIEARLLYRFWIEYGIDWTWFGNCFPEAILSKDCKKITGWVHQESCDSRFMQMNDKGKIDSVFLSKLWGLASDQYTKFDPKKEYQA